VGGADYPGPAHARAARWQPSAWKLAHIEAVARLRLYMTDHEPTASWISERVIRQRWAGTGARIADDALAFRDGGQDGIELELHSKVAHRSQATIADVDPAWSAGVWWFTPIAQLRLLQQRLPDAGGNGHHQVVTAPEGVAS
jgi:hypothetical protein